MMKIKMLPVSKEILIEYCLWGVRKMDTLIFIHYLGSNLRQFNEQQLSLGKHREVLLVSLRGHGHSSGPAHPTLADYSVRELAFDVKALISHLNIEKLHIVGNGLGGLVGYELLDLEADRIVSLTTFGTTAKVHTSKVHLWSRVGEIRLLSSREMAWRVSKKASENQHIANLVGRMWNMASKEALQLITRNIADYNYTDTILQHDVPMMLIQNELDEKTNEKLTSSIALYKKNPNFKLVELPGTGPYANMEKPSVFNRIILDFIRSLGRQSSIS